MRSQHASDCRTCRCVLIFVTGWTLPVPVDLRHGCFTRAICQVDRGLQSRKLAVVSRKRNDQTSSLLSNFLAPRLPHAFANPTASFDARAISHHRRMIATASCRPSR